METFFVWIAAVFAHQDDVRMVAGDIVLAATAAMVGLRLLVGVLRAAALQFGRWAALTPTTLDDAAARRTVQALDWVAACFDKVAAALSWAKHNLLNRASFVGPGRRK